MQVNRTIVFLGPAHNIHALVGCYRPYLQVDAILGHGPLLADLIGGAGILLNRRSIRILIWKDLQTQITMGSANRVITSSVSDDIKLLVVTGINRVAVEYLQPDGSTRAVRNFQTTMAGYADDDIPSVRHSPSGRFRHRTGASFV